MDFSTIFQETNDISAKIQKCVQELSSYLKTYPLLQELNNLDTLETSVLEDQSQLKIIFTKMDTLITMLECLRPISNELCGLYKHIDQLEERFEKLKKDIKQTEKALKKAKSMLDEEEQSIREGKPRPLWKYSTIAFHLPSK
ncbi:hypothetical protein PNEG_03038 [Pneumocystis murina B123]|uniref:Uncharacterized protein n=1 Tax=Pneumocystis murina (strain B123) TaxID=1069680 RepID=M7NIX6_PNEMU|nr:hypothetical protein PNEG_03038 [Pneumocystis murina B123]EMR08558.1 hypothetical protein PNEG_03038 [Pneumocystis murina B123]